MKLKNVVRFAVGAECDRSVDIWRFWTQGDEVYFGCRNAISTTKISLHSSGVWKAETGKKRFILNKRTPFSKEWDLGPFLVFPHVPVDRLELRGDHLKETPDLINLKAGDLWHARIIQIMFSHLKGQKCISLEVKENVDWQWIAELRNHGKVALVSYVRRLGEKEVLFIQDCKRKLVIWYKDKFPQKGVYSNLVVCESYNEIRPSNIISIPLGRENMKIENVQMD